MKYLLLTVIPFVLNNKRSRSFIENFFDGLVQGFNSQKEEAPVHRHYLPLSSDMVEDEVDPVLH
ncbi:MAG: hypothetical protein ACXVAX_05265 [Pseudobdellovibrio sp.]